MNASEPCLPRKQVPRRLEDFRPDRDSATATSETPEDHYRRLYFEAFDLIIGCITNNRFDQPGYAVYRTVEDLNLKAMNHDRYCPEFEFVTDFMEVILTPTV